MNCERAVELIIDSLVEPLSTADGEALDRHLSDCGTCAAEAAKYGELQQTLEMVAVPELPSGALDRLQEAVSVEFGDGESATSDRQGWLRIAAAIALIAVGGVLAIGLQDILEAEPEEIVAEDTRSRFLFVMTETTEEPQHSSEVNNEIQAWFADLIEQGILETDTAMAVGSAIGTPPEGPLLYGPVSGMVVIRAADEQEARRIAVSSPIIEYGGFIEIRSIE